MTFKVLTIFPDMLRPMLEASILGRAIAQGLIKVDLIDIRPYSDRKHKNTDDEPFGGGAGMVMLAQPIVSAMRQVAPEPFRGKRIFLSPRGATLTQKKAEALAKMNEAGKLQIIADILPELAKAVAEPFGNIDKITIIGGGTNGGDGVADVAGYVTSGLVAVSEALQETVGFDLKEVLRAKTFEGQTTTNLNISGMSD